LSAEREVRGLFPDLPGWDNYLAIDLAMQKTETPFFVMPFGRVSWPSVLTAHQSGSLSFSLAAAVLTKANKGVMHLLIHLTFFYVLLASLSALRMACEINLVK